MLLFGAYSIFQVKVDTNSRDLLAEGKAKQDLRIVEVELGGSNRLQINISTSNDAVILNTDAIKQLEVFQNKLEENPLIVSPVSVINIKSFLELFEACISSRFLSRPGKSIVFNLASSHIIFLAGL